MIAFNLHQHTPTVCHLCGNQGVHEIQNLCQRCEPRLPQVENACDLCALPLPQGQSRCASCIKQTPFFDSGLALLEYRKPVDLLFNRLKHYRDITVAETMAQLFAEKVRNSSEPLPDLIVPIPLSWKRQLARGFNQSQCIAVLLASQLGVKANTRVLKRIANSKPQQSLSRSERLKNLDRCFLADDCVRDLHVALVDDVMTTGATMQAAAAALYLRGTRKISVWTVARTPKD